MRISLTKSLVVLAVLSSVDARPWPELQWAEYLDEPASAGEVQAKGVKEVKIPKAEIPVTTVRVSKSTVQIPAPPKVTPDPADLGRTNPELDRYGRVTKDPFPTGDPFKLGKPSPVAPGDRTAYDSPSTVNNAPLAKRTASPEVGSAQMKRQFDGGVFSDLFSTPISTASPPAIFSTRSNHPVPRLSIPEKDKPFQTNKFYSNMYLDNQDRPVFTYPYSVWYSKGNVLFSNGTREPFGLSMSHVDQSQRKFGPTGSVGSGSTGAIESYLNTLWIRSLNLGAIEFDSATASRTMELTSLRPMSVDVNFYVNKALDARKKMHTPLCLGMGFISTEYSGLTPQIESSIFFRSISLVPSTNLNVVKYKVTLEDGKFWVIYAHADPTVVQVPFILTVINNGKLKAAGPFSGIVQIAKIGTTENAQVEAVLDKTTGGVCTGAAVTAQTDGGSVASYHINYTRYKGTGPLLMFALPHHYNSFTDSTKAARYDIYQLTSLSKGMMIAVVADEWHMREDSMPTKIGWMPVKSGAAPVFAADSLTQLASVARAEIAQDFDAQSNLEELYFAGKALGKFAYLCLTSHFVLSDRTLTSTCLTKLEKAYSLFTTAKNKNMLVYEYGWRGLVTDAVYKTGNPAADFGSGYYNDHHFHYSYFIHAAAVIAFLDAPAQGFGTGKWLTANKDWVNTLVRDVANPSASDPYFPVSRSFDYWHGHSWAKGLFESLDGKDEESSSEDANFAYAMKMWGYASGQPLVEARGNLMLAILRRAINTYMLISPPTSPHPTNPNPWEIHPTQFNPNRVSGILFENKVHHVTYFGAEPKHIQGIHMLPLSPISPYIRSAAFAQDEWTAFFSGNIGNINDGWKGVLYQNVALLTPHESWKFFAQSDFRSEWLDGGASRAWALAFAGMLGGA
ncbi:glycoside hydrolase family 81 protein [Tirmania nivea]|nr:glycoside hydrolase family 81 protein [Tirmania nivea]